MPLLLAAGLACLGVFAALDSVVRLRLRDAGAHAVFLRGGTLDYSKYLQLRNHYRWSGWPVYLMPVFLFSGVGFVVLWLCCRT
jgi:hypothetical protein